MGLVLGALLLVLLSALWQKVWVALVWRPYAITRYFRKQGVRGPRYQFLKGSIEKQSNEQSSIDIVLDKNSHDITVTVLARFRKWIEEYGGTFLYWVGDQPRLCITDLDMIREVLTDVSGAYLKGEANRDFFTLMGKGLFLLDGEDWARHRKIIKTAFAEDKIKMMAPKMAECTKVILERWCNKIISADNQEKEIEVYQEFNELAADVIARTAFGSNYNEEKELFVAHKKLLYAVLRNALELKIPGFRYLPTRLNLHRWNLQRIVWNRIMGIIQKRMDSKGSGYENDFLGTLIESTRKEGNKKLSMNEIKYECKTFLLAGYETIAELLAWAMFLLSINQDWQERLRDEVLRECSTKVPSADSLSQLKLVNMVLLETLRLYTPVCIFRRKTSTNVKLGNLKVPKGVSVVIPIVIVHRLEEIWGADANEFNPMRFENGVARVAKHLNAFLAFSTGARSCIGQNFVLMEAKIVIAMILQKFKFSLSHNYKHFPEMFNTLEPKHGLSIIFKPLNAE